MLCVAYVGNRRGVLLCLIIRTFFSFFLFLSFFPSPLRASVENEPKREKERPYVVLLVGGCEGSLSASWIYICINTVGQSAQRPQLARLRSAPMLNLLPSTDCLELLAPIVGACAANCDCEKKEMNLFKENNNNKELKWVLSIDLESRHHLPSVVYL